MKGYLKDFAKKMHGAITELCTVLVSQVINRQSVSMFRFNKTKLKPCLPEHCRKAF